MKPEPRSVRRPHRAVAAPAAEAAPPGWTFLTNHAHVLLCIAADPEARMRDVAARVGITERAVQRIVAELEGAGYLVRERDGRRNRYEVCEHLPLRHPIERHRAVASLVDLMFDRPRR
jgi:DNA-binding transcriptional ArsR family regulator